MSVKHPQEISGCEAPRDDAGFAGMSGATSPAAGSRRVATIGQELRAHAPFTAVGALTGIAIMVVLASTESMARLSAPLFWSLHPLHVLLSALVTTAMYRLHGARSVWATLLVGYLGSVGIATLSDCIIPYVGECLLNLPNRDIHLGFVEKWWLVNPMAFLGIGIASLWSITRLPHAGHVLLSTWASLFHMTMAITGDLTAPVVLMVLLFLFLAVWVPCCTSDIVFPLLFAKRTSPSA